MRRSRSQKRQSQQHYHAAVQIFVGAESLEVRRMLSAPQVADVLGGTEGTAIVGTVYDDVDSNGAKSPGENGVSGWTVYLDLDHSGTLNKDESGNDEPSAVTNADGDYVINYLQPGAYRVSEVVQPGWVPTALVSRDAIVVKDKETKNIDFFNFAGGDIVGIVWNDLNGDGTRDTDPVTGVFTDPGLANWTVFLDINKNGDADPTEPTTLTNANGGYSFVNVPAGDYEVTEVLPSGWDVTQGYDIKQTAGVVALQQTVQDFGNTSTSNGSIQGTIWNDLNINSIRDMDPVTGVIEPGLEGWTVFLDGNNNGTADPSEPTTLTDVNGNYSFVSVPAGDYEVTEILPIGWYVAPEFDTRQTVGVVAGESSTAGDFANFTVRNGSIRGSVWNDLNRDGVRNTTLSGEFTDPGIPNWQIFLDLNRNNLKDSGEPVALTDANGAYAFPNLQVGDYEVQEILPTGWETTATYSDSQTVTVFSGTESVAGDFANFNLSTALPGTVSGTVWNDLNGNGVREVSPGTSTFTDPGLANRVVFVDQNSNGILDLTEPSATSAVDGTYSISGVSPGTVTLTEVALTGWNPTAPSSGSRTIALKNAEHVSGLDFGNYTLQESAIRGTVYVDFNLSGTRDAGERGLDGITVYLDTDNSGSLDSGEPQTTTSTDLFFTPATDEAGTYSFTHLAVGIYTVRVIVPVTLNATPAAQLTHTVTLAATENHLGIDTAAIFRANEIHGVKFDDLNGDHHRDAGEPGVGGVTIYVDLNRNNLFDSGEPTTVTASDGAYTFGNLVAGAYVIREVLTPGDSTTYPTTVGGTLWPAGVSNPAVGNVTPTVITSSLSTGASQHQTVSITLPNTGALTNLVDVFLLFDDTGSFTNNSPIVRAAFPAIMTQLQAALPGIDLGFGVGRFEEYGSFAYEYSTGRPFVLNQPIVAASTPGSTNAIQAALNRTTPGYGGDQPETDIEALYQLVTGVGFDGNNNGSVLDSGAAGLASTQWNPGNSGDVPSFASFLSDPTNSVMAPAGMIGGGGFRSGALPIILTATDTGFAYQPKGETSVTGVGGLTLPLSALTQTSRATTPFNSGAGLQQTVTALDALGALVIGLGTNPQANLDPRQGLESLSKLTGAVNHSSTTIANGTADPIAPGDPFYFEIASGFANSVADGIVNAIQNAVTNVAVDITVQASDPRVKIVNHTGTKNGIGSGQTATFDIELIGDGIPHRFDLQFVRAGTNVVLGSIPVVLGTPVPGNGYNFEDLPEGEIHNRVDFGSHAGAANLAPTDVILSSSSIAENLPSKTIVGTLSTIDPDVGNTFTYSLVPGAGSTDNSSFIIDGSGHLQSAASFDFETKSSFSIRVSSTDQGGLSTEKTFTIEITNVNETPTNLSLSNTSVAETVAMGTAVGQLTTTDPDLPQTPQTFSYSLGTTADNAAFSIDASGNLKTAVALDAAVKNSYAIQMTSTDQGGLSVTKAFTISVSTVTPTVNSFTVQNGAAERSFVRYADVGFAAQNGLDALISQNRIQLVKYDLNGLNGKAVSLGAVTRIGSTLHFDFGSNGLGGYTPTGDGYYQLKFDLNGSGAFATAKSFYRLLGDVNGDRQVDQSDVTVVQNHVGMAYDPVYDVLGLGVIDKRAVAAVVRAKSRKLNMSLIVDG